MDPETQRQIAELQATIKAASERLVPGVPQDEWDSHKAAVKDASEKIEALLAAEEKRRQESELAEIKAFVDKQMQAERRRESRAGELGGPDDEHALKAFESQMPVVGAGKWLKALYEARKMGSPEAWQTLKATVGDTDANGGYIIPNNFVYQVIEVAKARNIYRQLLDVIPGVRGNAVDIPFEVDDSSLQRAIGQGGEVYSYGSNKDTRDFTLSSATATLFGLARIIDVGVQLLRQSEGAAERLVRSKLARAFALAEAHYILNGTGVSNQPKGIITSINAGSSAFSLAYSSGPRVARLADGIAALEARSYYPTAVVLNPADFWQIVTETLGSNSEGGWAVSPTNGPTMNPGGPDSRFTVWGVPLVRDPNMTSGTAIMGEWSSAQLFTGDTYRIDVSDEAGTRWDRNLVGFRAEEEIAFNADPYVTVGMFQRITGL